MASNHIPARPEHTSPGLAWVAAMRRGDFAAAWAVNDAVLAGRDPRTRDDPSLPYHQRWVWDGTPFEDADLLVRCYHGLGDTLQFSRYLPILAARARRLTVEAQPELLPFLAAAPGTGTLVPFNPAHPMPPAPCTLEIMEAGHVLRCLPPPLRLPLPPHTLTPRPSLGRLRAGLCWAASGWDPDRSVPPHCLGILAAVPGVAWTCLQQGGPRDIGETRFGPPLPPGGDVAGTAALLRTLDLVVTVDTMVAHLAGTLGVPALVMLKAEPDWRWLPDRARSPWYPSLRLCRQPVPGAWEPLLRTVARILAGHLPLAQTAASEELAPSHDSASVPFMSHPA